MHASIAPSAISDMTLHGSGEAQAVRPCRRPDSQAVTSATDPIALSAKRVRRLDILVQLRKVYRNLIRAEGLLSLPSPVYQPAGAVRSSDVPVKWGKIVSKLRFCYFGQRYH